MRVLLPLKTFWPMNLTTLREFPWREDEPPPARIPPSTTRCVHPSLSASDNNATTRADPHLCAGCARARTSRQRAGVARLAQLHLLSTRSAPHSFAAAARVLTLPHMNWKVVMTAASPLTLLQQSPSAQNQLKYPSKWTPRLRLLTPARQKMTWNSSS